MVRGLTEAVIELRSYVEAAIDFPEEEIDFLADRELTARFQTVRDHFEGVLDSARQGRLLREGMTVVIAGPPNAGKSSLLNRLAGYDAAIVTPIAGHHARRRARAHRVSTACRCTCWIPRACARGAMLVEEEGMRRAHAEMRRADRVLFVIDAAADPTAGAYREERARLPARCAGDARVQQVRPRGRPARRRHADRPAARLAVRPERHGARGAARAPETLHGLPER